MMRAPSPFTVATAVLVCATLSCEDKAKVSAERAREHASHLAESVKADVAEVRQGLPQGSKFLVELYKSDKPPKEDLPAVRAGLERARNKVQDLRVAKSTFFALVDEKGVVLRNDQEQDLMAGKNLLTSFPAIAKALEGKYVETRGSMPEAARKVDGDGQWVAAQPVTVDGSVKGLYVTGWSWAAYAYRLENAIRGKIRSELGESDKQPLVYVYMVVPEGVYGAPQSPEVNAKAIAEQKPLEKLAAGGDALAIPLEITGREFGLGVKATPELGSGVAVAVLRSET